MSRSSATYTNQPTQKHIQQYCEAEMPLTYDTTVVKASFDIAKAFHRWRAPYRRCSRDGSREKRLRYGASTWTPCLTEPKHGVLLVQQYRDRGSLSSTGTRPLGKSRLWIGMSTTGTVHKIFSMKMRRSSFFLSTSRRYIPGTGSSYERGSGKARSTTLNMPGASGERR